MSKRKKSGKQDKASKLILLITALVNLIAALTALVNRLLE